MLARGGMAVVYLVHQPALDRDVVLKRLDLEGGDPALAQRFVREARLAATLDHPNVVTLFDFFEHDGVPYIAMEYVAGGSLRELVGRLELPQVCGVVEGVLAGLGHAERQGIAHRDLKPENLLLTRRGTVKIADFGIARAYNALTQRLTAPGMAIGTPAYMAPEQATNEPLGPATDLYSLGVIAYELLAGRPPFVADTPVGLLYAHVHTRPPPLAALVAPERGAICDWVEWLLAKDPAGRPQSAAEAWDALEELAVAEMGPYWRRHAAIGSADPVPAERPPTARRSGDHRGQRAGRERGAHPQAARPRRRSRRPSSRRRPARAAGASGRGRRGRRGRRRGRGVPRPGRGRARPAGALARAEARARRDAVRLRRRRPPGARDGAAARRPARALGAQRRRARAGARQARRRGSLISEARAGLPRAPARRRRLRLGPGQRGLRPRRPRRPGDRHARPRARVRALRRRAVGSTSAARSSSRAAARTCRPGRAATASCSWRATSTGTATTTSWSARPASATGSRGAARCTSSSAAPGACSRTGRG